VNRQNIEKSQEIIESVLASPVNPDDGHDVKAKLARLSELLVVGSNCVTHATRIHRQLHGEWLRQHMDKINEMKPSVAKHFVDTALVDEQILVVRCENNYKSLCKCSDDLITILSYLKAEMAL
jgi:tRNA G18 (ribose-2'-O)-methylase SpoU